MTEQQPTKYCIDCKWIHQEEFNPGVNVSDDHIREDFVYLCNHPERRHLVTGKPVRLCISERDGDLHGNCGSPAQYWESKEVDPATLEPDAGLWHAEHQYTLNTGNLSGGYRCTERSQYVISLHIGRPNWIRKLKDFINHIQKIGAIEDYWNEGHDAMFTVNNLEGFDIDALIKAIESYKAVKEVKLYGVQVKAQVSGDEDE